MFFEIDPVCHMQVMPETAAAQYEYKGKKYYFCNPRCRDRFKANPEQFLAPVKLEIPVSKIEISEGIYTCPMHPEVRQHGPGACPKCGMALEAEIDRKSTRLNSSHVRISYAVFCLKKKKKNQSQLC